MTEEEMIKYFENRYAHEASEGITANDEAADDAPDADFDTDLPLPTTCDPKLWIVKVRMGEEKMTTLQLLRKCIARANIGDVS